MSGYMGANGDASNGLFPFGVGVKAGEGYQEFMERRERALHAQQFPIIPSEPHDGTHNIVMHMLRIY